MAEALKKKKAAKEGARQGKRSASGKKAGASARAKTATAGKGAPTKKTVAATGVKSTTDKKTASTGKAGSTTRAKAASAKKGKSAGKAAASARAKSTAAGRSAASTAKRSKSPRVESNPVADARHNRASSAGRTGAAGARRREKASNGRADGDLFMEARPARKKSSGSRPPRRYGAIFGVLNLCLLAGIAALVALGMRQQVAYADFTQMRQVVDKQTFYEGTTIEGVDVSHMTLPDAMAYWGERVEPRYAARTITLDNGLTVTAGELGYSSDYADVLSAAWSAGRNGSLEERYRMASGRRQNPVAYSVTRVDYDKNTLREFVDQVADQINKPAQEAGIERFDADTYEFVFTEAQPGKKLDAEALGSSIAEAISSGGGSVALDIETVEPQMSTTEVAAQYGLIDYAITNASSSSRARLNNIKLAMSIINGTCVAPGETFSFNAVVGQRTTDRGFRKATAYSGGDVTEQVGGGICQVSTTLFNAAVKADMEIVERHNHSLTVGYVDKGKDATVNWDSQDFKFKNTSDDNIYICCYLTEDKRVRFGIFGKLLPNGETITLDAVTTETTKFETQYQKSPLLAPGQTYLLQEGRNGYKAEAYKVRWDAQGNELSRELLCRSIYKEKDQIIQYGV